MPVIAGLFAVGLAALLGLPPFSLFVSEIGLIRAGTAAGLGWLMAVVLVLLLVVFGAISTKAAGMLLGGAAPSPAEGGGTRTKVGTVRLSTTVPLTAGLVAVAVLGIVDWPLGPLLHTAAQIVGSR